MRIEARDITVRLNGTTILDRVGFAAGPGELVGLIGPNGAGKSTLLSVLARLRVPDAGSVLYDAVAADNVDARKLAQWLAFLTQSGRVEWPLTVERVVALGRLPYSSGFGASDAARDEAAISRAMRAAEIEQFAGRSIETLSGGERTRVLLARALAVEADMLLADEPTAALDPYHQLEVMELLARTVRDGAGVVVVLHDLSLAARFCDRLVLLTRGRVVAEGRPDQVLTEERIAEIYGVSSVLGAHEGQPFVVPWRRLPKGSTAGGAE
ncbi:ABC transporter ATP-binding protein [Amorphus sp. 3PC139-8]|uniref:ABC transporter ATP-binding protein n=1 Tax=Amorphus sp. 3PC139-8 TaxID=2735676 RepID=UPI00345DA327